MLTVKLKQSFCLLGKLSWRGVIGSFKSQTCFLGIEVSDPDSVTEPKDLYQGEPSGEKFCPQDGSLLDGRKLTIYFPPARRIK